MGNGIEKFKEQATAEKPKGFPALLEVYKAEVARALPEHMRGNIERYTRIALTCFRQNPKLAECDPRSVFAAVILSGQLGLELGVLGHAYLVPYKGEATFVPGWRGYVDLVHRSGRAVAWTGAVFEDDEFDYAMGDSPFVKHKPAGEDNPDKITHTYAIGRVKGIDWPIIEVMSAERLKKHFKRFNKVGERHYGHTNWEMYARKIPLLQVVKYLPASVELAQLVALEGAGDGSGQSISIKDAIDGTFTPEFNDPSAHAPANPGTGEQQRPPASPAGATGTITPEVAFSIADDHLKNKRYDEAMDLFSAMRPADQKIIKEKLDAARGTN